MVCPFLFVKLDISIDIIYRFAAAAWRPICGTGTSACGTVGTTLTTQAAVTFIRTQVSSLERTRQ